MPYIQQRVDVDIVVDFVEGLRRRRLWMVDIVVEDVLVDIDVDLFSDDLVDIVLDR